MTTKETRVLFEMDDWVLTKIVRFPGEKTRRTYVFINKKYPSFSVEVHQEPQTFWRERTIFNVYIENNYGLEKTEQSFKDQFKSLSQVLSSAVVVAWLKYLEESKKKKLEKSPFGFGNDAGEFFNWFDDKTKNLDIEWFSPYDCLVDTGKWNSLNIEDGTKKFTTFKTTSLKSGKTRISFSSPRPQ